MTMWEESSESKRSLRTGLTTGTCATACALAAGTVLLTDKLLELVNVQLPSPMKHRASKRPKQVIVKVSTEKKGERSAYSSTIKNAGDDPDITHGATIFVTVSLRPDQQILFSADSGVGTVTRPGLALDVGEPAINPIPRQMIRQHLETLAAREQYSGGFSVKIGVINGEALAKKTMNPKLGIIGGLSILGTTGIVRPFSCSAWIASIHQGMDIAKANHITHIAACTGNSSEKRAQILYSLDDMALIEMGDFVGAVLKHLKKSPIDYVTICGGFGKISKLANGHMDLHSRASSIDFNHLAKEAELLGASKELIHTIRIANTSINVLHLCQKERIPLGQAICQRAFEQADAIAPEGVLIEIIAVDRQGDIVGRAGAINPTIDVTDNKEVEDE